MIESQTLIKTAQKPPVPPNNHGAVSLSPKNNPGGQVSGAGSEENNGGMLAFE